MEEEGGRIHLLADVLLSLKDLSEVVAISDVDGLLGAEVLVHRSLDAPEELQELLLQEDAHEVTRQEDFLEMNEGEKSMPGSSGNHCYQHGCRPWRRGRACGSSQSGTRTCRCCL